MNRSTPTRRAVIDVGTNSVKLLVADVLGREVTPVLEDSEQTRLGRGFYETHILQPQAIEQTSAAVARFGNEAAKLGATSIRVIATSAARDAKNADDLRDAIQHASKLTLEVISGEKEADWAFQGVTMSPQLAGHALLIFDVGGGSTEFIVGEKGHCLFRESFDIGTVRLLEKVPHSDPPTKADLERCHTEVKKFFTDKITPKVKPALERCQDKDILLVGTGGTTTILARMEKQMLDYDRDIIESARLSQARMGWWLQHLWSLPLQDRQKVIGLPPKRADVILYGVVICLTAMELLNFRELRASTRGLRYAALMATE